MRFTLQPRMVEVLAPGARRLRPLDVIAHFEGVVLGELDLRLRKQRCRRICHQHRIR
jgi:diphthamide synthase (EF-2-diphthine--ammonia ligase)